MLTQSILTVFYRELLKNSLDFPKIIHSVRDEPRRYTRLHLAAVTFCRGYSES